MKATIARLLDGWGVFGIEKECRWCHSGTGSTASRLDEMFVPEEGEVDGSQEDGVVR